MRLADFIYPPRCICCFEVVKNNALTCDKCGKELEKKINFIDYHTSDFDCTSLYKYEGCVREIVYNIKFKRSLTVCKKVGALLADEAQKLHAQTPFDIVAYVPMTKTDLAGRGFNQCEVFAKIITKRLGLDFKRES